MLFSAQAPPPPASPVLLSCVSVSGWVATALGSETLPVSFPFAPVCVSNHLHASSVRSLSLPLSVHLSIFLTPFWPLPRGPDLNIEVRGKRGEKRRPRKKFNTKVLRNVGEHPFSESTSRRNRLKLQEEYLGADDLACLPLRAGHSWSPQPVTFWWVVGEGVLEQEGFSFASGRWGWEP